MMQNGQATKSCAQCKGRGYLVLDKGKRKTCVNCRGTGRGPVYLTK
jgi:DnaJ-class molecular chaperone